MPDLLDEAEEACRVGATLPTVDSGENLQALDTSLNTPLDLFTRALSLQPGGNYRALAVEQQTTAGPPHLPRSRTSDFDTHAPKHAKTQITGRKGAVPFTRTKIHYATTNFSQTPVKVHPIPLIDFHGAVSRATSSDSQGIHAPKWATARSVPDAPSCALAKTRDIIGSLQDEDPYWDQPPVVRPGLVYNPPKWSSVPLSVWLPDFNWTLCIAVLAANGAVTTAIHFFSDADAVDECSHYGLCGSGLTLDSSAHSTLGLALFLLLSFRVGSSYEKYWEGRKLWGLSVSHYHIYFSMGLSVSTSISFGLH